MSDCLLDLLHLFFVVILTTRPEETAESIFGAARDDVYV